MVPQHSWRITPEFSYGLSKEWEAGLYLPTIRDANGNFSMAGVKLRLKWLPRVAPETGGWFWGGNLELAHVGQRYEQAMNGAELRPIVGWRDPRWLVSFNPVLGYNLTKGYRGGGFDFGPAMKLARKVGDGIALGVEAYAEVGKLGRWSPRAAQEHTLYFAVDVDKGPIPFNFGIGRGLNGATDKWTVKFIFDVPL